jgi:ribosomal-protein-alanine N-acetyltransferase
MILDEAHITLLVIDEAYRGQGFGRALLIALLEAARVHDMARATLEVRPSNEAAIALYNSFGFKEAGRRKQYYHAPTEDALILWRSGLQSQEFADNLSLWKEELHDRLHQSGWKIEEARV